MGLLGGKKTYVTSVVYNLAGDVADRPSFFKSVVNTEVVVSDNSDLGRAFKDNYITGGPGVRLRAFGRWSQGDYADKVGLFTANLAGPDSFDMEVLATQIPHDPAKEIWVQRGDVGRADYSWWAEQWMLANHKDEFNSDWEYDVIDGTSSLAIKLEDGTEFTVPMVNYDPDAYYVYGGYTLGYTVHHPEVPAIPGDPEADPPIPDTPAVPAYDEFVVDDLAVYIYKIGSGNPTLDAFIEQDSTVGFYYPPIPFRIDNKFVGPDKDKWSISDLDEDATEDEIDDAFEAKQDQFPEKDLAINFPDLYPMAKRAFKKATGNKFDKIATSIAKNISLKDIDYAYAVFGASLNSEDEAAQKYLWRFFNKLADTQGTVDMDLWEAQIEVYNTKAQAWRAWVNGGSVGPEPEKPVYPALPTSNIRVVANGSFAINYDIMIRWDAMALSAGTGLGKPGAKKGDVWWVVRPDLEYEELLYNPGQSSTKLKAKQRVAIVCQVDDDQWEAVNIWDLVHLNYIYKGKAVETSAKDALEDDEESGFIMPLHYGTMREMNIVDSTQLATSCTYLVFNCYKVVKKKWYQTFIFQIILIAVIIAITIIVPPIGAGGGSGLLGSNAAVGAAVGLTGTAAIVAGAIINAVAAMLVLKAVGAISTAVFGAKIGAIIGAVAGVVAITVGSGVLNGGTFSSSIGQLARPDKLVQLSNALSSGYAGYVKASIMEMSQELETLKSETADKLKEIDDLYEKNIGYARGIIDPMNFVDQGYIPESGEAFLSRTLMTGSDVIEFMQSLVTDFTALTLSTELPS